ncbi:MAG TPA: N-acetylneuraminate synthase family protein, partial [Tepidisphaeraceae bacterium]|nr:N-acetylneuraminate synthase family protein [Tepidisphaeraceae bacterium]
MIQSVSIGDRAIGNANPVYIIGEIGLNHNGDVEIARKLIDVAKLAGCDAVKFQKRTPELCVPIEQRDIMRETPWGLMTYLEYRRRVEFGEDQYAQIDEHCRKVGIDWFASCWDEPSVDLIERFAPVCHKIASACLTDEALLRRINETNRPIILSTGMSDLDQIKAAIKLLDPQRLILCHTTSSYPCKSDELNLRCIESLANEFGVPVGYSGHEVGLQATYAAVALGACLIERHITLDRAMWGSDQAASVEPAGLIRLVRDIRVIESALGDGRKRVYESEKSVMAKLRRNSTPDPIMVQQEQLIKLNRPLRDRHAGQRCFIIATGPSIRQQDLSKLAGENIIAVSNLFVHPEYQTIAPKYHCIAQFHKPITEEAWQAWMDELAAKSGDAKLFFGVRDRDRNLRDGRFEGRNAH